MESVSSNLKLVRNLEKEIEDEDQALSSLNSLLQYIGHNSPADTFDEDDHLWIQAEIDDRSTKKTDLENEMVDQRNNWKLISANLKKTIELRQQILQDADDLYGVLQLNPKLRQKLVTKQAELTSALLKMEPND